MIKRNDNVIKKYKKSIYLDRIFYMIPLALLLFIINQYYSNMNIYMKYGFTLAITIWTIGFFISDVIFKNQSLGKKLVGIEIVNSSYDGKKNVKSLIYRRLYDSFHHLMRHKSFIEKCQVIEEKTRTKIIIKNLK